PTAAFSATNACAGSPIAINNASNGNGGTIYSNYWTFQNNGSSSATNPSPVFNTDGSYQLTLVTTTTDGCRDTAIGSVEIHPLPVAAFGVNDGCLNTLTSFNDASSISSGNIVNWNWNMGNNSTSSNQSPSLTYSTPGSYNVSLTVVSDNGCSDNATGMVNIFPVPDAQFTSGNVCFGSPATFLNQSSVAGGENLTSSWSFSGGNTSTLSNPSVIFPSAGLQQATLQVTT
ncbi:MAG: PKD domain-containing protein, partial [Flavobacteriales bacterium]